MRIVVSTTSDDPQEAHVHEPQPDQDELARAFDEQRAHLLRVAYATTGSWAEAEDCVQEAWLRLRRSDASTIRNLRAWLTTTVGRLALDALGSARVRRERYVGTWLPEPVVDPDPAPGAPTADPADRVTLDESISMALLVVLERLSPAQRAAFVLHDVFGMSFDEVSEVVGRTPAAVRQLATRARRDVADGRPRFTASPREQRRVVDAFLAALTQGDLAALVELLDPDVVVRADGGGRVSALRGELRGAQKTAKVMMGFARQGARSVATAQVNGAAGIVAEDVHGVLTVMAITVEAGRIAAIDVMRNPEKLRHVHP
jgi:RNA polymerase sigma-70 factor, ECF subfamily